VRETAVCALLVVLFSIPAVAQNNASLYSDTASNLFLFRDLKARNVNDIVTIVIVENSTASNSANTSTQKKGDVTAAVPGLRHPRSL